jgi:glycine/D-amino acid oxidase-like deaminating enzyme
VRVVVVGAGVLGASVADELAGRGVDVVVVEAATPGAGTSASSFAWVNAQEKSPPAYFELNAEGVRAYPGLAAELGGAWFHPGGDLALGRGPGAERLREKVERHRAAGYAVRDLDRAGVAALEPGLDLPADGELAAAHFPDEAWIDAPAFVAARLARAAERGAKVRTGAAVTAFERVGDRLTAVVAGDERTTSDVVVLAAGPATEALAALADVPLPMAPNPGLLVTTTPIAGGPSRVVHAGDVALRPDGRGGVLLSSREVDATLDPDVRQLAPDASPVGELLERGRRVVPALRGPDAAVATVRIGVRSVARDGMPVAGFAPSVGNLYLLVAHSGVTLAPVLGRLVADEVAGGDGAAFEAYRPARFA